MNFAGGFGKGITRLALLDMRFILRSEQQREPFQGDALNYKLVSSEAQRDTIAPLPSHYI